MIIGNGRGFFVCSFVFLGGGGGEGGEESVLNVTKILHTNRLAPQSHVDIKLHCTIVSVIIS